MAELMFPRPLSAAVVAFACLVLTECSSSDRDCPPSWRPYAHLCVRPGRRGGEQDNARYCDAMGAIGIRGHCVIKAGMRPLDGSQTQLSEAGMTGAQQYGNHSLVQLLALYSQIAAKDKMEDTLESEELEGQDSALCEDGWYHYRELCVYRPLTVEERCHALGAVEFNGHCLKHAKLSKSDPAEIDEYSAKGKRICCCAHPNAMPNNYAC